eukprot:821515-Alexandrium_andersonii.AAC.1
MCIRDREHTAYMDAMPEPEPEPQAARRHDWSRQVGAERAPGSARSGPSSAAIGYAHVCPEPSR